jgi:TRAP-type C4-dicarboxylate transport system permease small subunit
MDKPYKFAYNVTLTTQIIAGVALTFMLLITLSEVILRAFGKPIIGSHEIIAFSGGIVIGFAIPYTSWTKTHVYVDVLTNSLSKKSKRAFKFVTRLMGLGIFALLGWNLILMAFDLYKNNQVSLTLRIPFYPLSFGIGISCLIQSVLLLYNAIRILGGKDE